MLCTYQEHQVLQSRSIRFHPLPGVGYGLMMTSTPDRQVQPRKLRTPLPSKPKHLPRVAVWLQSREGGSGHDFLCTSAPGEMPRRADASLHRVYDLTKAFDFVSRKGVLQLL
ncbi:hypothetical protein RRG08_000980 [Elysia crispata]|uniref:Uncharacterized protein n=1 Tax=Elysia crispata TaxID=231223 RepID=A0AAE1AFV4_9GAST|nr:hypothetical protein RRG08_000980 [Elysia crispata]